MRRLFVSALFAVIASLWSHTAWADEDLWDGILSDRDARACEDPYVLNMISDRFRHQAFNVLHLPTLRIADFYKIHEHRYLPFQEEEPIGETYPIARRYCGATVALSDGRQRTLWYLIEDRMGFVGIGDNVEFCVSGFDRWLVYNGGCRILRPGAL